jgi:hypothetical protein
VEIPKNVPLSVETALAKARQELSTADPALLAGRSYAQYFPGKDGRGHFLLPYFAESYLVDFPTGEIALAAEQELPPAQRSSIPLITQVLLLHYLLNASGADLTGNWITYRELPQGSTYERAFRQRAVAPLEVSFGYDLDGFVAAGLAAGGERARLGDASFFFRVLPRVPLMCVLWLGDDEVPPGANILYDAAAGAYLHGEDLAYLGIALTARLLGARHGALLT